MATRDPSDLIQEFLGSAHIFSATVRSVVEERVLADVIGDRLTFSQYKLLRLVSRTDGHSIGQVASFLGVSDAAASKAVQKLVRSRLLNRAEGKPDRRTMHLSLTRLGRRWVEDYEEARNKKMAGIFEAFPADELRRAAELLDRLSASLVSHGANPEELCLQCGIYFRNKCLVRQLANRNCFYARHLIPAGAAADAGNGAKSKRAGKGLRGRRSSGRGA